MSKSDLWVETWQLVQHSLLIYIHDIANLYLKTMNYNIQSYWILFTLFIYNIQPHLKTGL